MASRSEWLRRWRRCAAASRSLVAWCVRSERLLVFAVVAVVVVTIGLHVLGPFELLFAVSAGAVGLGIRALRHEHRSQHDILAFDVIRVGIVICGTQCLVALAGIIDPTLVASPAIPGKTTMASGTLLSFAGIAFGWGHFFWFRAQANRGTHPWQRQNISEAAAQEGSTLAP